MIGILGALDIEVAALLSELEHPEIEEAYGYKYARGALCGREVVIAKCGVGKVNAAVCTQTMVMKYAPELIINTGVAGSLSPELKICDIAVGRDVVQHDFDSSACGDPVGFVSTVEMVYFPCDLKAGGRDPCRRARTWPERDLRAHRLRRPVYLGSRAQELDCGYLCRARVRDGIRRHRAGLLYFGHSLRHHPRDLRFHGRRTRHGIFPVRQIAADNSIRVLKKALSSGLL